MTSTDPAIALHHVTVAFGDGRSSYTAVSDASLALAAGEFVSIVGPTGSGKSTLLNVAAGLSSPAPARSGSSASISPASTAAPATSSRRTR